MRAKMHQKSQGRGRLAVPSSPKSTTARPREQPAAWCTAEQIHGGNGDHILTLLTFYCRSGAGFRRHTSGIGTAWHERVTTGRLAEAVVTLTLALKNIFKLKIKNWGRRRARA
jgi:hypothetical protein